MSLPVSTDPALGLTAAAYAEASTAPGGRLGALERYARLFREGRTGDGPVAPHLAAPIHRLIHSESPEGTVVKFTQQVPRHIETPPASAPSAVSLLPSAPPLVETESVLIPMVGRRGRRTYTLCVSSQVGCAMGCGFCQTAQMGLLRSLTPAEIVGQWFAARHLLDRPDPHAAIGNIVFMGMGEPLDNLASVLTAISVLTDHRGPAMPMSRITVSTVGRVDALPALFAQMRQPGWHRLGLAISLNAPTDDVRSALMPVNRAYPLARLRRTLEDWPVFGGAHLCFEYVLIPGVNDQPAHADALAAFVLGREAKLPGYAGPLYDGPPLKGMVNVIPYNPRDASPWPAPGEESVAAFVDRVHTSGVFVKRRRTKGRDTMAACGQLGNPELRRKPARI